jgi:DNA-directed RNA polymerase specialized sigma24 family protein
MHSEARATSEAVRMAFCTQFKRLHLQAHVITGCPHLASECILEALDVVNGSFVASPEFAYEASKLATIKAALRRVSSEIKQHAFDESASGSEMARIYPALRAAGASDFSTDTVLSSLLRLNAFYRALLLLRLYEGYRVHEVAVLLHLPSITVRGGMMNALLSLLAALHGIGAEDQVKDISLTPRPLQSIRRDHDAQRCPATAARRAGGYS